MSDIRFGSFEEFWPFYVSQHSKEATRALHFVGTSLALGAVAAALIARRPALLLGAPLAGYGFAWMSHYFVEKNRPATFTNPLWSLRGDARMWWRMLNGTMEAEAQRVAAVESVAHGEAQRRAAHPHAVN